MKETQYNKYTPSQTGRCYYYKEKSISGYFYTAVLTFDSVQEF